jgi:hypothetical protein
MADPLRTAAAGPATTEIIPTDKAAEPAAAVTAHANTEIAITTAGCVRAICSAFRAI